MENEIVFKKAIIGGFDRNEVIKCIAQLQEKACDAQGELEELKKLQETVSQLEALVAEKDTEIDRLSADIAQTEGNSRVSRTSAQLMRESVDYADRYVESAKLLAEDISNRTNEKVDDAKEKINSLLLDITRISEDILALYTSLTELKAEYDSFGDVYPPASSDNYLAEDEETNVEDDVIQADPLEAAQGKTSAPHQDADNVKELIRKTREKYKKMI